MNYFKIFILFILLFIGALNLGLIFSLVSNYHLEEKCSINLMSNNTEINQLLIKLNIKWQGMTKNQLQRELASKFPELEFYSKGDRDIMLDYEIIYEDGKFKTITR